MSILLLFGGGGGGGGFVPPTITPGVISYRLDIYDTAGVLQYQLTDFTGLYFVKRVNSPGIIQFSVSGDHEILGHIADKWVVEVWRRQDTWTREAIGLYRMLTWVHGTQSTAMLFCNGIMSMLDWRIIAWTAGYADRSKFTGVNAETIANTLVKYNATTSATVVNGRLRDGSISGVSVEVDGNEGNSLDWFCAYDNLLESLQELAQVGGGDFDLVQLTPKTTPTTWQWRWYKDQLGSDRSTDVTFALARGNMANPVYQDNKTQEKTVAVVGGTGEGNLRDYVIRTGSGYHITDNNIEMFVGATDVDTTAGLNTRGDQKLAEVEAVKSFSFDVLQIPSCLYGVHYFLGDKVAAVNPYNDVSYIVKIQAVMIGMEDDGSERIAVEMSEPL